MGVPVSIDRLRLKLLVTTAERQTGIAMAKNQGLDAFHQQALAALSHRMLAVPVTGTSVAYDLDHPAHFKRVGSPCCGLDDVDCQIIRLGAWFGAWSGNPGGAVLALAAILFC